MSVTRVLFDVPPEVKLLPRDARGYPVPKFATWENGVPNFVVPDPVFFMNAINQKRCWICGNMLGRRMWFVVGPICTITGVSNEPPCHRGCATFAVRNCPYITRPLAKRAEYDRSELLPGMVEDNPGLFAMYETKKYGVTPDVNGNPILRMGAPVDIKWWKEGRPATGDEVLRGVASGIRKLYKLAGDEGPIALAEMEELVNTYVDTVLRKFLPPVTSEVTEGLDNPLVT